MDVMLIDLDVESPEEADDKLSEEDYWAVVAYLLERHGFVDANIRLNPQQ